MVGTLACLILSMTGTAALLGWIDPTRSVMAVPLTAGNESALAVDRHFQLIDFRGEAWNDIEVLLLRVNAAGQWDPVLTFFGAHLYVDALGGVAYDDLWLNQDSPPDRPRTLRIVAILNDGPPEMSPPQTSVVASLVDSLTSRIARARGIPTPLRFINPYRP